MNTTRIFSPDQLRQPLRKTDSKSLRAAKRKYAAKYARKSHVHNLMGARNKFGRNTGVEILLRKQRHNKKYPTGTVNMSRHNWKKANESEPLSQFGIYKMDNHGTGIPLGAQQ